MPFTFSHPAAVLPAKLLPEKWVSMTALIIGSITPDFEYFIRMRNLSLYSHTWIGMLWFDLPIGFTLCFVYHFFVRDALIDNLPQILRKRLNRYKGVDWATYTRQHIMVVLTCLLVGIATHIAWDGFTHRTGCFVILLPWLKQSVMYDRVAFTRYYILQFISSVIGMIAVIYAIYRIPKDEAIVGRVSTKYWLISAVLTICILTTRVFIGLPFKHVIEIITRTVTPKFYTTFFNHPMAVDFIMALIASFLLSLIITPLLMQRKVAVK